MSHKFVYSGDEENYSTDFFDTREQAIATVIKEGLTDFYTGTAVPFSWEKTLGGMDLADQLLDYVKDENCEQIYENAEEELEDSKEEIQENLLKFLNENVEIGGFNVEEVEHFQS